MDDERLDAEDLFVPCCHGLVSIEQGTQIFRLVHYTVQQYLDENRSILLPDAEALVLRTCLTYLSFNEFNRGRCKFETLDTAPVTDYAKGTRVAKRRFLPHRLAKFPFLQYAASNWGRHAVGEVGMTYRNEILVFLRNAMLLESAAQVHDRNLLYSRAKSEESTDRIRRNLPLFVAVSFGLDHTTTASLTGLDGIDVDATYGKDRITVPHHAVETGNAGLSRVLL